MTEMQHTTEGMSAKPRIKPAEEGDDRPLSVSARLGRLQFHHSGKFRVLQIADIQDGPRVCADTVSLIAASLDAVRPDLVVFTGNQIAGYDRAFSGTFTKRHWSGTNFDNEALEHTRGLVRKAISQFLKPLTDRHVPFAVTFGNHDFQCGLSNAELEAIYCEFPGCLNALEGQDGCALLPNQSVMSCAPGTFALPVTDAESESVVLGLALLDSGDYARGGGFASPSADALDFLKVLPARMGVKSLVFQHMPLPQYYDLLQPAAPTVAFAMQGYSRHAEQYYVLDESKTQPGGYLGEGISCPDQSGEFEILQSGFIGVCTGHDHRNGFVGTSQGVLMIATPTCGFGSYGPAPAKRATRLIEFDIRHPYEPRTQLLQFGDLVGKPSSKKAYIYAMNAKPPQEGEGDDLLRRPSLWARLSKLLRK
ncbi:metallophosphoesterase [Bifidobacterium panos]|uniref:Serine/threonine protein phosphatase n=1 Tax=Bifidobacterium panos TaxID=2675321 RepID=A0ABX1SW80_9BIFI|nr:metallophosphoesterase [Bifidobacterium sp. DSM 109963]NMN02101.1 serine/threonine protein phosphatase [Bifidobacterium sp. DSM 109963]